MATSSIAAILGWTALLKQVLAASAAYDQQIDALAQHRRELKNVR